MFLLLFVVGCDGVGVGVGGMGMDVEKAIHIVFQEPWQQDYMLSV